MTKSLTARAAWVSVAKAISFAANLAMPLVVVRSLDRHDFGLYKQVFLVVNTAIYVLPIGFPMSVFYFLPREPDRKAEVVFNLVLFCAAIGGAGLVVLSLWPGLIARLCGTTELTKYSPWVGAIILFWMMSSLLELVPLAEGEVKRASLFIILIQLAKAAFLLAAVLAFRSVEAIVYAAVVHGALTSITLIVYLKSRFKAFWRRFDWPMMRTQISYAIPVGFAAVLTSLQSDLHNYFVSNRFGPDLFAVYAIGCLQLPLLGMLRDSTGYVTIPLCSQLQKQGDSDQIIVLTTRVMRKLCAIYLPVFLFLLIEGRTFIIAMFTTKYASAWPIFAINLLVLPFDTLMLDPVFRAYAEVRFWILRFRIALMLFLVVALWAATRHFGMLGAITVVVVIAITERVIIAFKLGELLRVGWQHLPLMKDPGKIAIAACIAATATMTAHPFVAHLKPILVLMICGALYSAAYIACILALRVPSEDERKIVRDFVRKRLSWKKSSVPLVTEQA